MTLEQLQNEIKSNEFYLVMFKSNSCRVCMPLIEKLKSVIEEELSYVKYIVIDVDEYPEIASSYMVFASPIFLMFIDGRETIRENRFISISKFIEQVQRAHEIMSE